VQIIVMVLKTPKFSKTSGFAIQNGLSYLELLLGITMLSFLVLGVYLIVRPEELKSRARDETRMSDLSTLSRIIDEFRIDYGRYPDIADVPRISISLPVGNVGPLFSTNSGWIMQDLSRYNNLLPVDPLNDATYFYSYQHDIFGYELNARLEYYADYAANSYDGGNDDAVYEIGNSLTIF
jgi:hypothetical protein